MDLNQRAEYLAETYADAILRLSYTYLKSTHDAQDICQTVFVKLLTEPRTFETPEHERSYVLRMAANTCKDLLKSPWRKRTCGLEACAQIPAPEIRTTASPSPPMPSSAMRTTPPSSTPSPAAKDAKTHRVDQTRCVFLQSCRSRSARCCHVGFHRLPSSCGPSTLVS